MSSVTPFRIMISLIPVIMGMMSCAHQNKSEMIDEIMSDYSDTTGPGASVLVMRDDTILFSRAYGLADISTGERLTTEHNFRLASVTKQFTAMTILMLHEAGKLSLEDTIRRFFPDFPEYGRYIRIRHLLTHTSGLLDYEDLIPDTLMRQVHDSDCLALMHETDSLYFAPGTSYRYSNTGYALLALITERVTGARFADVLHDNIFRPVGMRTTVAFEEGISSVHHRAYGHSRKAEGWIKTDQSQTSAVLGDGGIYSNPSELATWVSSLWRHRLISDTMQRQAWSKALLNNGQPIDYGYGWHLDNPSGPSYPHHDGSTMGFRNHMLVYPDRKMMIIVLTNRNEGQPRRLAERIAALYRDE
jgi:CubicO group peptidase (beta-lactamase class C family)